MWPNRCAFTQKLTYNLWEEVGFDSHVASIILTSLAPFYGELSRRISCRGAGSDPQLSSLTQIYTPFLPSLTTRSHVHRRGWVSATALVQQHQKINNHFKSSSGTERPPTLQERASRGRHSAVRCCAKVSSVTNRLSRKDASRQWDSPRERLSKISSLPSIT